MPLLIVDLMNYMQENYAPILGGIIIIIGTLVIFSIINDETKEIKKKNVTIETMNDIVYESPSEFSHDLPLEKSLKYTETPSMIDQICTKFDKDTDKINCKLMSKYGNFEDHAEPIYYESTNQFNISEHYDLNNFNKLNNFNILDKM